jgi:Asp-tRNA(Asn)/Glu-tRNA(Gln) amidotransferase A subunit family amidase
VATPATGTTRKTIGVDTVETRHGPQPDRPVLSCFSALVNHMGCPAIVGPLAGHPTPPPGLQLVAPWWQEHRLLEIAATLERAGALAPRLPE